MEHQTSNCNCRECIWERIRLYAKKQIILTTKKGIMVTYKVEKEVVVWLTIGPRQNVLYNQNKKMLAKAIEEHIGNKIDSSIEQSQSSQPQTLN